MDWLCKGNFLKICIFTNFNKSLSMIIVLPVVKIYLFFIHISYQFDVYLKTQFINHYPEKICFDECIKFIDKTINFQTLQFVRWLKCVQFFDNWSISVLRKCVSQTGFLYKTYVMPIYGKLQLQFLDFCFSYQYTPIAKQANTIKSNYDVIVIGSGYGGAVAASRAARAGLKVCLIEKGMEWLPGDFPETMEDSVKEMCLVKHNDKKVLGNCYIQTLNVLSIVLHIKQIVNFSQKSCFPVAELNLLD